MNYGVEQFDYFIIAAYIYVYLLRKSFIVFFLYYTVFHSNCKGLISLPILMSLSQIRFFSSF